MGPKVGVFGPLIRQIENLPCELRMPGPVVKLGAESALFFELGSSIMVWGGKL